MHSVIQRYHQEWNWARKLDAWTADLVTQNFTFTDSSYSIRSLLENSIRHGTPLPRKKHEVTRKNRQVEFDFAQVNNEELAIMQATNLRWFRGRARDGANELPDQWQDGLAALSDSIESITARGGQVVIVRMPTSGPLRREELQYFPRDRFWDDLARKLPASAILHFEDYPAFSRFELPDDSHLDYRDAAHFTRTLFEIIEEDGVALER
jgi:hypothetical protein